SVFVLMYVYTSICCGMIFFLHTRRSFDLLYFSYTKYLTVFSFTNLAYKVLILITYILYIYFMNKKDIDRVLKSDKIQKVLSKRKDRKSTHLNSSHVSISYAVD